MPRRSRPHEPPPEPRLRSWPVDAYMPRQLQRLQLALEDLHLAAQPESSSIGKTGGGAKREGSEPPGVADPDQRRCRRKLDRLLSLLDRLADECEMTITGSPEYSAPGHTRCDRCGRGQRVAARFCDGCGARVVRVVDTA